MGMVSFASGTRLHTSIHTPAVDTDTNAKSHTTWYPWSNCDRNPEASTRMYRPVMRLSVQAEDRTLMAKAPEDRLTTRHT